MANTTRKEELELLKQRVQLKFAEIQTALHMREKLLLRQIDVIATSQLQMGRGGGSGSAAKSHTLTSNAATTAPHEHDPKEVKFLAEQEDELLAAIRGFGRFQLDNMNLALQDVYLRNEDYITPSDDHETMYKCLQEQHAEELAATVDDYAEDGEAQPSKAIVVDFSRNKTLINAKHMNESIINITLAEAKELIRKAKLKRETHIPPLNLEELDDELESSIAEAVSSLGRESPANTKSSQTSSQVAADTSGGKSTKPKKNRFKPKITINNCNGTINLRNISSLTINCATEDSVSADLPLQSEDAAQAAEPEASQEDTSDEADTTTTTPHTKSTQKPPLNANYKHASVAAAAAESSSTENTTPTSTTTTTASSSNYSSNASSRSQSKKQRQSSKKYQNRNATNSGVSTSVSTTTNTATATTTQPPSSDAAAFPYEIVNAEDDDDDEANIVPCEFYNRLLNEIKNSLKGKTISSIDNTHYLRTAAATAADSSTTCDVNSNASCSATSSNGSNATSQPPAAGKRLVLKNFENLKIILEANSDEETLHPVQIEQWLAEIISETDAEPVQNTDILEHSNLHNENA